MFLFYMAPLVPFLVLGLTMALGRHARAATATGRRRVRSGERPRRAALVGRLRRRRYLGLVIVDFAWMWPLFTGGLLTYDQWHMHMWFPSWV